VDEVFAAVPGAHEAVAAAHHAAGAAHHAAGSAHSEAHLCAAAAALGPIGANFLAHYAPAQANCLAATMLVGDVYHALGAGTQAHKAVTICFDNA
jgi:hypothetical protein